MQSRAKIKREKIILADKEAIVARVVSYLIFVPSTTSGAGVKLFSLVSKCQKFMPFSCKKS